MLERAQPVGVFGEPDLEAIAALAPDLIVGEMDEVDEALWSRLSALAPTVVTRGADRGDWKAVGTGVADAAGEIDAPGSVRAAYDAEVARLRDRYAAQLTGEVCVGFSFGDGPGEFSIQFPSGIAGAQMTELGMTLLLRVAGGRPGTGYESYSVEQLGLLGPATVAVYPVATDDSPYPALTEIMAVPLYAQLPVVAAGRAFQVVELYGTTDYRTGLAALREPATAVLSRLWTRATPAR